ncbi:hypothetical protein [Sorangium sp. So ce128]|uniref:hypothetical protein n=1 Tax=Sorangium sp. So ce128 TaxID=3133281 RepID=UPI003F5D56A6
MRGRKRKSGSAEASRGLHRFRSSSTSSAGSVEIGGDPEGGGPLARETVQSFRRRTSSSSAGQAITRAWIALACKASRRTSSARASLGYRVQNSVPSSAVILRLVASATRRPRSGARVTSSRHAASCSAA